MARKLCSKILCANIVFPCFCCAKRQATPCPSPLLSSLPYRFSEFPLWQRKLYQCASFFSAVCCFLPFFFVFLSFLDFRAFVLHLRSAMYWHFQRLFVSFSLTLLLFLLLCSASVLSWLRVATCNGQRAGFLATDFTLYPLLIPLQRVDLS